MLGKVRELIVSFESAIVPKWGASTICFRNVYVSRRSTDSTPDAPIEKQTKKTKTTKAPAPRPFLSSSLSPDTYYAAPAHENDNYTMFDINLEEVEVTLSFMRWLDGKGLVKDAKVKGVRGVVGELNACSHRLLLMERSAISMVGYKQAFVASRLSTRYALGRFRARIASGRGCFAYGVSARRSTPV